MHGLHQQKNPPVGSHLSKLPWFGYSRHHTAIVLVKKQKSKTLIETRIALPVTWADSPVLEDWLRKPVHVKNKPSQYSQSGKNPCVDIAMCFLYRESACTGLSAKPPEARSSSSLWIMLWNSPATPYHAWNGKLIHASPFNNIFLWSSLAGNLPCAESMFNHVQKLRACSPYNKPSSVPHSVLQPRHHCIHCHQTLSSLALAKTFYDYLRNVMLS